MVPSGRRHSGKPGEPSVEDKFTRACDFGKKIKNI
jgi:hypothetical protein